MGSKSKQDEQVVISFASPGDEMRLSELTFKSFLADKMSWIAKFMFVPSDENSTLDDEIKKHAVELRDHLDKKDRVLIKASINDKIVGYTQWAAPGMDDTSSPKGNSFTDRFKAQVNRTRAQVFGDSLYWYLMILVIDPDHWNMGIGRRLMDFGHELAKQKDDIPVPCFLEASLMAELFYVRFGYQTLAWDQLDQSGAPDGVVRWPYMIRRQ